MRQILFLQFGISFKNRPSFEAQQVSASYRSVIVCLEGVITPLRESVTFYTSFLPI